MRDLGGRTRRLLLSVAIGVGGVVLISFGIHALFAHDWDHGANGFDVWMLLVGMVGLTVLSFGVLNSVARRAKLPKAKAHFLSASTKR